MIKIESKKVIGSAKKLSVFIIYFLVYIRYLYKVTPNRLGTIVKSQSPSLFGVDSLISNSVTCFCLSLIYSSTVTFGGSVAKFSKKSILV